MFTKWREATRSRFEQMKSRIEQIKRSIRKWIFYTKMTILIIFIIAVALLLTWLLTLLNPAGSQSDDEVNTPVQSSPSTSEVTQSQEPSSETAVPQTQAQRNEPLPKPEVTTEPNEPEPPNTPSAPTTEDNELASPSQPEAEGAEEGGVRQFTITAYPEKVQIDEQLTIDGWTYNRTFPGPIIRVKEGEQVRIVFRNQVPDIGSAIHLHGIPTRNSMDGVPTVTQPPVNYGEQFIYEFTAEPAGTYSYHAHSFGKDVLQLDKGLFAPFIIETVGPTDYPKADTEWVVSLDEMKIPGEGDPPPATDGNRMDQSTMNKMMPSALLGSADLYNVFTINGKRDPKHAFEAKANEWVRLRLLNFGFQTHRIKVEGMKMYETHTDGHPLPAAQPIEYATISPYERVDVYLIGDKPGEYEMTDIDPGHSEFGMRAKVVLTPSNTQDDNNRPEPLQLADPPDNAPKYQGITAGIPGPDTTEYDRVYNMNLGMTMGSQGKVWAINGVTWDSFEEMEPYKVRSGETIKVNMFNRSPESHPMHLHGHPFRVIAINGQTLEEPWIVKDTINVRPMQRLSITFEADNPGDWIFHCHQSHHSDNGLMTYFSYVETTRPE